MSGEPEARMWDDDGGPRFETQNCGDYYEPTFASEQLDRAPLLSEEPYTEVAVGSLEIGAEHCHWKAAGEPPSAVPQLVAALVLCAIFMVCEAIGGYLAGSLSVMCDAAHMMSDCSGFVVALVAIHMGRKRRDAEKSFGYKRTEVLGAVMSVHMIWMLTGVFVYLALERLHSDNYDIDPDTMMIVSGSGVAFNVVMALVLHGCGCGPSIAHHHTHGGGACSHANAASAPRSEPVRLRFHRNGREVKHANGLANGGAGGGDYGIRDVDAEVEVESQAPTQTRNINLRAALVHVIGDLIQSCGVLLASVLIKLYPAAKVVDPICTFIFSFLVLMTTVGVMKDSVLILMEAVPKGFRYRELVAALDAVEGVRHVHSVNVWSLSTHHQVMSAHVAIDELADPEQVLQCCQRIARADFGLQSATVQVERYTDSMLVCGECRSQPELRA